MIDSYEEYKDIQITLQGSRFLNLSAEQHRYAPASTFQNVESLVFWLGYDYGEVKRDLPALRRRMAQAWYANFGQMPLHQWCTYWSDDQQFSEEQIDADLNEPDSAHPFGDALVPVYPFAPFIRRYIDNFFKAFGIEADEAEREWEDWKGFDPALIPRQNNN